MIKTLFLTTAFTLLTTFSASAVDFDYSSQEAYNKSTSEYIKGLPKDERIQATAGMMQLLWDVIPETDKRDDMPPFAKMMVIGKLAENSLMVIGNITSDDVMEAGKDSEFTEIVTDMVNDEEQEKATALAPEAVDTVASCLKDKVTYSNVRVEHTDYGVTVLEFDVTNNLSWPISFIYFEADVKSANRSVSWETTKSGLSISGGVEPGETRETGIYLHNTPNDAKDLVVTVTTLDVADAEKRQVIGKPKFSDNADTLSPNLCE